MHQRPAYLRSIAVTVICICLVAYLLVAWGIRISDPVGQALTLYGASTVVSLVAGGLLYALIRQGGLVIAFAFHAAAHALSAHIAVAAGPSGRPEVIAFSGFAVLATFMALTLLIRLRPASKI